MPNSPCMPRGAFGLQAALDRIADVRGDIVEVGLTVVVPRHAFAVIAIAR